MKPVGFFQKVFISIVVTICVWLFSAASQAAPVIVDHNATDITRIPQGAIEQAKQTLHIAYGHTSHGSQLTTGMEGLVAFANDGGLGLILPDDIFAWNDGGTDGALDLQDYAMEGDVGYYPDWVNNTRAYLNDPSNADVNVIVWSWCGQVEDKYTAGTLDSEYLTPMARLEAEYPDVKFVYMTGHVDIWDDAVNKAANRMIRQYCTNNDKILYDFADIEHYDPDGAYYEFANDSCDYYDGPGGNYLGNWALEWQSAHIEGQDWYACEAAHSEPLNANRKAYAAWWLWAELAGWNGVSEDTSGDGGMSDDTNTDDTSGDDPPADDTGDTDDGQPADDTDTDSGDTSEDDGTSDGATVVVNADGGSGGCFISVLWGE